MGNAFALILKYGKYLMYLPLLAQLVTFIRTAQARYKEAGSGAEKAQWVQREFSALVDTAAGVGLIGADFAKALREGSLHLITIIVQGMKDAQGTVPPLDEGDSSTPVASAFPYEKVLETDPDRSLLKSGDRVYQFGDELRWIVRQAGVGIGALPAGWKLIETVR
jgi:hypothetical protein